MRKVPKWIITLKQSHSIPSVDRGSETIWTVIGLKDNVEFEIGQSLVKKEVEELCKSSFWNVIVK